MQAKRKGWKYLILLLSVTALLLGIQTSPHACPILNLDDGIATVTIQDGGLLDSNPWRNRVAFEGKVEHYWYMNATTGNVGPNMVVANKDYKPVNANSRAGVVPPGFHIPFSEDGLAGESSSGFSNSALWVGSTTRGKATFNYLLYGNYTPSGSTPLLAGTLELDNTIEPFESMAPSDSKADDYVAASAPVFPAIEAGLSDPLSDPAPAVENLTFGFSPSREPQGKVPEPITVILFGVGFAGAGLYRRFRRSH